MMSFTEDPLGWEYSKFCKIRQESFEKGIIDLSSESWFYPTKLMPLAVFINESRMKVLPPTDESAASYYRIITGGTVRSSRGTYLPIVKIPTDARQRDRIFDPLEGFEDKTVVGGSDAVKFFVAELVNNVYDHSGFSNAYVMAQMYPSKHFFEISIVDNGISIPGSFERAGYDFSDGEALSRAIQGLSTKPEGGRGYGLGSCLNLLMKGLRGQGLIVSKEGGVVAGEKKTFYKMGDYSAFEGTLISVRIPYQSKVVDIYDFIS
jgi:hypothetical protein